MTQVIDPLKFGRLLWPHVTFYDKQIEVIYSVVENDETIVPAGNMLGKDFVAGFLVVWFFMTRHPCRVVTTSAKEDHLRVLWGEINRFIETAVHPLKAEDGGPLVVTFQSIRKVVYGGECPLSYVVGKVASPDRIAAMQGHHIAKTGDGVPRTLFASDESSSVPDSYFTMARTWAERMFIFGNPWPCENYFRYAVKGRPGTDDHGGDLPAPMNGKAPRFWRKVIRIRAEDSPNVNMGLNQQAKGITPTDEMLIPGVKPFSEYLKNRATWDAEQQCVSLDADWYEGPQLKMFPREWLELSAKRAEELKIWYNQPSRNPRHARTMGVDSGQGKADTSWAIIDDLGLIKLISERTPDTSVITGRTIGLMREYGIQPGNVLFDRGGGGKEHADRLRLQGYEVRTIAFGEQATAEPKHGLITFGQRKEEKEVRYAFRNRRAEMYGLLRQALDPSRGNIFALPAEYTELRRQLLPIPLTYDDEGRLVLPPKNKRSPEDRRLTMTDLIGRSPDDADALCLAYYGLTRRLVKSVAGVMR